jgi:predicted ATPase
VIGREFTYELLASVAEFGETQLQDVLGQLTSSGLLFARGMAPQATYMFKHALVQDAAYGTLLRRRRQNLHARIAESLEKRFPETTKSQPELLAHHLTEAAQAERAIEYWKKAGQQALMRSAMKEGEALLRKGLSLVSSVPDGSRRQDYELDLRLPLGRAVLAIKGFGAPEAAELFARARELGELIRPHKLLPIVFGQWIYHVARGDMERAEELTADIRQIGETRDDIVARVAGCRAGATTYMLIGNFTEAHAHLERGLSLYHPVQRSSQAELAPADTLVSLSAYLTIVLACSGHLDQARSQFDTTLSEARRMAHAFSLAYALSWACNVGWVLRIRPPDLLQLADELLALSSEGGWPFYRASALATRGWCMSAMGEPEKGIPLMADSLASFRATGTPGNTPDVLTKLADACRMAGQLEPALTHIVEAGRIAEATQTKWVQAETLRLRGDLLIQIGDRVAAESRFREAIVLAQQQNAKLFELRASTSLARLWRNQGKLTDARDLLAPIYNWFTEGFDALDLKDAKALLGELA